MSAPCGICPSAICFGWCEHPHFEPIRNQAALANSLGQVTCGFGTRHNRNALTNGACLKCGAAL